MPPPEASSGFLCAIITSGGPAVELLGTRASPPRGASLLEVCTLGSTRCRSCDEFFVSEPLCSPHLSREELHLG